MKRYVSLICCLVFVVSLLAFPISAEETSSSWYNVLDYSSANNTGGNYFSFTGSTTVSYELPAALFISSVSMTFMSLQPIKSVCIDMPSSTTYPSFTVSPIPIGTDGNYYFYEITTSVYAGRFYQIDLTFVAESDNETYVEITNFRTSSKFDSIILSWDYVLSSYTLEGSSIVPSRSGTTESVSYGSGLGFATLGFEWSSADSAQFILGCSGLSDITCASFGNNSSTLVPFTLDFYTHMEGYDWYSLTLDFSNYSGPNIVLVALEFTCDNGVLIVNAPSLLYTHGDYDSLYPYYYGIVEELKSIDAELAELLIAILESNQLPDNFNFIMSDIAQMLSDIRNGFGSSLLEFEKDFDNIQNQLEEMMYGGGFDSSGSDFSGAASDLQNSSSQMNNAISGGMDQLDNMMAAPAMTVTLAGLAGCFDALFVGHEITICGVTANPFELFVSVGSVVVLLPLALKFIFRKWGSGGSGGGSDG